MAQSRFTFATTTAVGTDALAGVRGQSSLRRRMVDGIILGGSAAAGDYEVDLFIGDRFVGTYRNPIAGEPTDFQAQMYKLQIYVAPAELIHLYVRTAPTTNAAIVYLAWKEF